MWTANRVASIMAFTLYDCYCLQAFPYDGSQYVVWPASTASQTATVPNMPVHSSPISKNIPVNPSISGTGSSVKNIGMVTLSVLSRRPFWQARVMNASQATSEKWIWRGVLRKTPSVCLVQSRRSWSLWYVHSRLVYCLYFAKNADSFGLLVL